MKIFLGIERAFAFQRFGINPDGLAQAVNLDDFLGMKKRMTNGLIGQNRLSENSMISQGGFKATCLFTRLVRRLLKDTNVLVSAPAVDRVTQRLPESRH